MGHSRPKWAVRAMSGLPLIATELRTSLVVRSVPKAEVIPTREYPQRRQATIVRRIKNGSVEPLPRTDHGWANDTLKCKVNFHGAVRTDGRPTSVLTLRKALSRSTYFDTSYYL
jgi:hypothetical protein